MNLSKVGMARRDAQVRKGERGRGQEEGGRRKGSGGR